MSVDELRKGFERLTAQVVAQEDPYGRVVRRAGRTRRRRIGVAVAGAVAAVLVAVTGGGALQAAGGGGGGDRGTGFAGWPITSEWVRAQLNAPTRGSAATDFAALNSVLAADRALANPNLPHTKVLWIESRNGYLAAVVARYSSTHAVLDAQERLSDGQWTSFILNDPVRPVIEADFDFGSDETLGLYLPPPGCQVEVSMADGTWVPDGAVLSADDGWRRVTCGGTVHQLGLRETQMPSVPVLKDTTALRAGTAFELTRDLARLPVAGGTGQVLWTGTLPGSGTAALVAAPSAPGCPAVLLVDGSEPDALLATGPADATVMNGDVDPAANQTGRDRWGLLATGGGTCDGLVAVRVPAHYGAFGVLTTSLLVHTARPAVRVEALNPAGQVVAQAPVTGEIALLTLDFGAADRLRAVASDGTVVGTRQLSESAEGRQLFGEQLIDSW